MSRTHVVMRLIGFLLILFDASSAWAFHEPATASLPLSMLDNRAFTPVSINGQGPFSFILDTGSSSSMLSADLARQLRLPVLRDEPGEGAGEKSVLFRIVHIDAVMAGPFSLGALDLPAMDMSRLDQVIGFRHFDGVLGVEIFRNHVVTLDAAQGRLGIQAPDRFRAPAQAVAIPFALDENDMPVVTANVAGISGAFEVDTGDRSSLTLFGHFWRQHGLDRSFAPTVTAMTGYGAGGSILGLVGRSPSFKIGDLAVPPPVTRLSLQQSGAFTRTDRAGSIGMGVLKRFIVSFDYRHRTMWLSKGAGFDAPDLYDRSGLWLGWAQGSGLEVMAVTRDSPAAKAGIQAGDIVTQVGKLVATPETLFEIRQRLQSPQVEALSVGTNRNGVAVERRLVLQDQIAPPRKIAEGRSDR